LTANHIREVAMQGLTLLLTFAVMAVGAVALAATVGIVLDNFPGIHDMLSVLGFFGTLAVLLPVVWVLAVRVTEQRGPEGASRQA
jgi:nucleoside permease NupC